MAQQTSKHKGPPKMQSSHRRLRPQTNGTLCDSESAVVKGRGWRSGLETQRTHCSFTAKTAMIAMTIAKGIAKGIA